MKTQIVETYLPIFPGFYNSLIDGDSELENFLYFENLEYDQIDFDFKNYQNVCSLYACKFIANELNDLGVLSVEFQELISPKFYNYSTDSINCKIEIETEKIAKYILDNNEAFEIYLKDNYTSYDGFIAYFSTYTKDWACKTDNFTNFIGSGTHFLGSILNFICQNENINENDLCNYVLDSTCIYNYISVLNTDTEIN
jgi:hypothetical protein